MTHSEMVRLTGTMGRLMITTWMLLVALIVTLIGVLELLDS